MTPLEKVEALYEDLVEWYGDGEDREIRAATKLLMVALVKLQQHGGPSWQALVDEYRLMLANDPERFQRMLAANRAKKNQWPA